MSRDIVPRSAPERLIALGRIELELAEQLAVLGHDGVVVISGGTSGPRVDPFQAS
jgi:hypothetical protein